MVEFVIGFLLGAGVLSLGVLFGSRMTRTEEPKEAPAPVATPEEQEDTERQWRNLMRYDGASQLEGTDETY
nr:MAG TPA: Ellis van Creveld protein 2 like protein [Caudoviricetes sp.]